MERSVTREFCKDQLFRLSGTVGFAELNEQAISELLNAMMRGLCQEHVKAAVDSLLANSHRHPTVHDIVQSLEGTRSADYERLQPRGCVDCDWTGWRLILRRGCDYAAPCACTRHSA
jgi:hypothetical protein